MCLAWSEDYGYDDGRRAVTPLLTGQIEHARSKESKRHHQGDMQSSRYLLVIGPSLDLVSPDRWEAHDYDQSMLPDLTSR